jgi:cell wall-associated NlpC family hydrolase
MSIRHAHRASRARTTLITKSALGVALAGGLVVAAGLPASADMPAGTPTVTASNAAAPFTASSGAISAVPASFSTPATASGAAVLDVAARYVGTPYVYGGTTPAGFDCSGYTQYVFRQVGITLPRTANQQMLALPHVSAANARAGDLVFYTTAGHAYHVGIYAGGGKIYDAPHTGAVVSLRSMWAGTVVYGRALN